MKKQYPSERGAELWNRLLDALKRSDEAPFSPITKFHSPKERRELRRKAIQLRRGQLQSESEEYTNSELADIYDVTARRDQIIDEARADFRKTELVLHNLADEEGEALALTFRMMFDEAVEGFRRHGPASEDAQRVRRMQLIIELGQQFVTNKRRGNENHRAYITRRFEKAPVAPPREPVFIYPPEGGDPSRERMSFRIGIGMVSWIGIFEKGNTEHCTVQLMPDQKHLLITAGGAGYLIDAHSRTLVERLGDDIVEIGDAYNRSVYFVNHGNRSFEAFGMPGRLWKTEEISCGGFRNLDVDGETFVGEARRESEPEWVRFSVKLTNGEVSYAPATEGRCPPEPEPPHSCTASG